MPTSRTAYAAIVLIALASIASGCRPLGKSYTYLQFRNLDIGVARTRMTVRTGDASADARKLMDAERYAGAYELGSVTVRYPEGCRATAEEVARAFADSANLIALRLGIEWSFDLEIRLVRVPQSIRGLHYSVDLTRSRKLVFPVFLNEDGAVRADWAPVVAHEMTEASMLAPLDRRKMVLGDAWRGSVSIPTGARWFRDGVSEHAGDALGSRLFGEAYCSSASGYADLARAREAILDWDNSSDARDYYAASAALISLAENRAGDHAVSSVMKELAGEDVPGGHRLRRAFGRATGLNLPEYLRGYSAPSIGAEFTDTRPDTSNPPLVLEGNEVVVSSVHPDTPASRWKLAAGDVILTADGTPASCANRLGHIIAQHSAGESVELRVRRGAEVHVWHVKLAASRGRIAR